MESSPQEVSSLRAMHERRQAWLNEKPQGDWGNELRYQEGDVIIFRFVASGNDGDQFIKLWRGHEFEVTRNGRPGTEHRFCPVQNGEGDECGYCAAGHTLFKERMSMWLDVTAIMHTTMPPEKTYPQVDYQSRLYFVEEVKAFKVWHASAWRDSCWNDILNIAEMYKGLHSFTAQLVVTGKDLARRYKIYALPNSEQTPPERYEQAKAECQSIPIMLREKMASPVQTAPQSAATSGQPAAAAPPVTPWRIPGSAAAPEWRPAPITTAVNNDQPAELPTPIPEADPTKPLKSLW